MLKHAGRYLFSLAALASLAVGLVLVGLFVRQRDRRGEVFEWRDRSPSNNRMVRVWRVGFDYGYFEFTRWVITVDPSTAVAEQFLTPGFYRELPLYGYQPNPGQGGSFTVRLPLLSIAGAAAIVPVLWEVGHRRRHRRRARSKAGLCPECGYDVRESATVCPECGTPRNA
jgi:hypothetical protein